MAHWQMIPMAVLWGGMLLALLGYVGWRLIAPAELSRRARNGAWLVLLGVLVVNVASRALVRTVGDGLGFVLAELTGLVTGLFAFTLMLLVTRDLLWLLALAVDALARRLAGRSLLPRDGARRRRWLARSGLAVLGSAALVVAIGYVLAKREPVLERVTLEVPGLAPELDGYRIAQLTDVHLGGSTSAEAFARVVARVNALEPDLVAVTGDLGETPVARSGKDAQPLASLKARDGVFFVPGNHEIYAGVEQWVALARSLGATVLLNEHRIVERGSARLLVAGVPNATGGMHGAPPGAKGIAAMPSDPAAALRDAPPADYRILLAHQPSSAYAAERAGFDLTLAGHTHGGQFFPMWLISRAFFPVVAGLGKVGNMTLYVSRGVGVYVVPVRLDVPAELTLLELKRK